MLPICDRARSLCIDAKGEVLFLFSLIDGRVGSGVDDQVGTHLISAGANCPGWLRSKAVLSAAITSPSAFKGWRRAPPTCPPTPVSRMPTKPPCS